MTTVKTEAAFTPGPWDAGSRVVEVAGAEFTPVDSPEGVVAFVPAAREANAHLIASAPKMYEGLLKIRALSFDGSDFAKIIDPLLAKARGDAPSSKG